jgi:hypothetical protein
MLVNQIIDYGDKGRKIKTMSQIQRESPQARKNRLASAKGYRETHKKEIAEKNRIWREANREHMKAYGRAAYAAKRESRDPSKPLTKKQIYWDAKNGPCSDCKQIYPNQCMELDHVRGSKLFPVSQHNNHSREELLAEIAKCDRVCSNCHRVRTASRHGGRKKSPSPNREINNPIVLKLKEGPCWDCGRRYHPFAMEFDHIKGRGEKKFIISQGLDNPLALVLEEIAKCDLVCSNCHRIRTRSRMIGPGNHRWNSSPTPALGEE